MHVRVSPPPRANRRTTIVVRRRFDRLGAFGAQLGALVVPTVSVGR
jgi:hypothetical protein